MKFLVFDIESDGLLDKATKIHCLGVGTLYEEIKVTTDYETIKRTFLRDDYYFVGHNVQRYDKPLLEKILGIKLDYSKFIDTLAISWALYPKRAKHGLESWGEDLGIQKVKVEDEEWAEGDEQLMNERVSEDVRINIKLFNKMVEDCKQLYDDSYKMVEYFRYLSFKMYTLHLQELNPFKLDVDKCRANLAKLEALKEEKIKAIEAVMPKREKKAKRKPPAKPFKKDGTLSATGQSWLEITKELGLPFEHSEEVEIVVGEEEPSANSPQQLKDWLFSLGWKPEIFTEGANDPVPQIYDQDKNVCKSVLKLGEATKNLEGLGILKHRIGLLKGFLRDVDDEGYIYQSCHGFTSTLRLKHARIVNLPKPSVPYGREIRECLTCDEGYLICGSDLSALEDKTKQNFIIDLDPEYVNSMQVKGYDSHLSFAEYAKAVSKEDSDWFKEQKKLEHPEDEDRFNELFKIRHRYKQVNYMSTYSVGAAKLGKYLEIPKSQAKKMIDDYWGLNWSVKKFAESCKKKKGIGKEWILNPFNGFWYELRSEKDRFSAVNQGTGSFIFDCWCKICEKRGIKLTLQMHDEQGIICRPKDKEQITKILEESIEEVNNIFNIRIKMGIDVQFGNSYAEVH